VVAVAALVGLAQDDAAGDGRLQQRRHAAPPVGGEHGVDADLAPVEDQAVKRLDPLFERVRHPAALGVVRRERLGLALRQLPAPVLQLGAEQRQDA
jgi:hypothetical protein